MDHDQKSSDLDDATFALRGEYFADDPYVFEKEATPWEIMATPLDPKPFRHWKHYLVTPSLVVYREFFETAVRLRGLAPAGMLCLTLPLKLGSRSAYWDAVPRTNGLHAALSESVDAVFDCGQTHIMILIDLKLLHRTLPTYQISALKNAARNRFISASPNAVYELARWLNNVLDETVYYQKFQLDKAAVVFFEEELLSRLIETIVLDGAPKLRPQLSTRQRGLDRALRYLNRVKQVQLTVPELCNVAAVSQRTLEYAFKEAFGLTPIGFLRLRRFHNAHYELMAACSTEATVMEIAHRNGFLELGRFAMEYRNHFGEPPSRTLQSDYPQMLTDNFPLVWQNNPNYSTHYLTE